MASSHHPALQPLATRRCGRERAGWAAAGGCPGRGGTGVGSGSPVGPSPHQDVQTSGSPEAPGPPSRRTERLFPPLHGHPHSREAAHSMVWGKDHSEGRAAPVAGAQPRGAAAPLSSAGPARGPRPDPGSLVLCPQEQRHRPTIPAPANRQSSVAGVSETGPSRRRRGK